MKHMLLAITLLAVPACLAAEDTAKPFQYNGSGYAYFDAGVCQHGYRLIGGGGGAEGFIWRGLALGADAGYHGFSDGLRFGLVSLDLGYHFVDRTKPKKIDPFVNFSVVGAAVHCGVCRAGHFGGGLNYWFKDRVGLRTEVRLNAIGGEEAIVTFHIGFSFR